MTGRPAPVTVCCREGHEFATRGNPGSKVGCPQCRAGGREVRVRVPGGSPLSLRGAENRNRRRRVRQAEHEEQLPLSEGQRLLITAARENLREINQAASRAARERDRPRQTALLARREEVSALLERLLGNAEADAVTDVARLMTSRPKGR